MARKKKSKHDRACEPSLCNNCQYIGDGDFICDEHHVIVIESWDPTENYLCCCMPKKERKANER